MKRASLRFGMRLDYSDPDLFYKRLAWAGFVPGCHRVCTRKPDGLCWDALQVNFFRDEALVTQEVTKRDPNLLYKVLNRAGSLPGAYQIDEFLSFFKRCR